MKKRIRVTTGTNKSQYTQFFKPSSQEEVLPVILSEKIVEDWKAGGAEFTTLDQEIEVPDEVCEYYFYDVRGSKSPTHRVKHHPSCAGNCGASAQLPDLGLCVYYKSSAEIKGLSDTQLREYLPLIKGKVFEDEECTASNQRYGIPQYCWCYRAIDLFNEIISRGLVTLEELPAEMQEFLKEYCSAVA